MTSPDHSSTLITFVMQLFNFFLIAMSAGALAHPTEQEDHQGSSIILPRGTWHVNVASYAEDTCQTNTSTLYEGSKPGTECVTLPDFAGDSIGINWGHDHLQVTDVWFFEDDKCLNFTNTVISRPKKM